MEECASELGDDRHDDTNAMCLDSEGSSANSVLSRRLAPRWGRGHAEDAPARRLVRESADAPRRRRADSRTSTRIPTSEIQTDPSVERSPLLQPAVAVGKTVAPTGTPGNTDVATTRCQRPARGTCADASGKTSAQLVTGVENGFEAVAGGFPDSLRRMERRGRGRRVPRRIPR